MPPSFVPTQEDTDRYLALRAAGKALNSKLVNTIPRAAYLAVKAALGISDRTLQAGHEEVAAVMTDSCLFDWFENGKNLVQRYCEALSRMPPGDEGFLLSGYLASQYRMLVPISKVQGAGVHCHDALSGDQLFMMDIGLSRRPLGSPSALATRTIPLGSYCMGAGAGMPIDLDEKTIEVLLKYQSGTDQLPRDGACGISLLIARKCFEAGFGDQLRVAYVDPDQPSKKRWPHRRRR